tara:strand:+ start:3475 stop:4719 length:1245 start_codon:yes stop_codon:yes gene_type:complete
MSIGLIYSQKASSWKSCTKIVANLLASYSELRDQHDFIEYFFDKGMSDSKLNHLVKKIEADKNDELIFIDHRPHPLELIKKLSQNNALPQKITFHLYGNFMLDLSYWKETLALLNETLTKFIAASSKQAKVVESVLDVPEVLVCPYPVDESIFKFAPDLRQNERQKRNLGKDDVVFLYTGRFSQDKNSIDLLDLFSELHKKSDTRLKLFLAGTFDDLINPMLSTFHHPNNYQFKYLHHLKTLPKEVRDDIHFLGEVDDEQLTRLYNMADIFISLSLYHDEDFGMSPIESLMCGTRAILTDWGGYHSFACPKTCSLIETKMTAQGAVYDKEMALELTAEAVLESRTDSIKFYHDRFSIKAVSTILTQNISSFFSKSAAISELGEEFLTEAQFAYSTQRTELSASFLKIYRNYASS